MRGFAIVLLVASLVSACNTRQRVAGGGAGLSVVGLALTFSTEEKSEEESGTQGKIGIACILTGLVVLFVAAALEESATEAKTKEIRVADQAPPRTPTVDQQAVTAQKKRDQAWALTKQAQEAARAGDCAKVTELSAQVGAIDAEFYADVFMKDQPIQRCFVPADATPAPSGTPVPPPPPAPSGTPVPPPPAVVPPPAAVPPAAVPPPVVPVTP
jgi:predicted small secreted protein